MPPAELTKRKSSAPAEPVMTEHERVLAEAYKPDHVSDKVVRAALATALAGVGAMAVAMCVLAAAVSLFVIYLIPAPGTRDLPKQMEWARYVPWNASANYVTEAGIQALNMTVLPSGVAYEDIEVGGGEHVFRKGDYMQIYYKMYLAQPRMGPPKDAMSAPDRFPFVFSRATDSDSLFAIIGEHGDDLLPGVEEGLVGMRIGGKRKLVVPPASGYGMEGFTHKVAMTTVSVPPGATLLFYIELVHGGPYEHDIRHSGGHSDEL